MHIKKLELYNFQSHLETKLEFVNGFNCIVGPTRTGKTSLIRALSFILFDEWHDVNLRKGADYASVIITLDNGTIVQRDKGPEVNKITVTYPNGEVGVFEKFGISAPPEVKKVLGIYPAKIDTDYEFNLNLSDQDSPPFLLSETAPSKTKFLNRLTGLHIVDAALRSLNKDKLNLTSEKTRRQETIDQITIKLIQFKLLDTVQTKVVQESNRIKNIEDKLSTYIKLTELQSRLTNLEDRAQQSTTFLTWCTTIGPKLIELRKKYFILTSLQRLQQLSEKFNLVLKQITEVENQEKTLFEQFKVCPVCGKEL